MLLFTSPKMEDGVNWALLNSWHISAQRWLHFRTGLKVERDAFCNVCFKTSAFKKARENIP